MAKLQDGTRIYGTANVDTALNVNTYFTANASQVKIGSPLSSNGSTGTAGQILVSGGANNAYWGSTTPLYNYSAQFNGSSSYLSVPSPSGGILDLTNSSAFTIEAWVWINAFDATENTIISTRNSGSTAGYVLRVNPTGTVQFFFTASSSLATTATLSTGQWYHISVVRSSANLNIYINGVSSASSASWANGTATAQACVIGYGVSGSYHNGFISNIRVVKGVAVYTGAFTVPTSPLTTSQSSGTNIAAVSSSQVSLLTCNALTLTDASPNALAITNNGGVVASATTYPTSFPQSAVYVPTTALTAIRQQFTGDGSTTQFNISGGYTPNTISVFVNGVLARNGSDVTVTSGSFITFTGITPPNGSLIDVTGTVPTTYSSITPVSYSVGFSGSSQYISAPLAINWSTYGSYTMEFWAYFTSVAGSGAFGLAGTGTGGSGYTIFYAYGSTAANPLCFAVGINGVNEIRSPNNLLSANTWYHIAFTYDGTTTKLYLNGVLVASGTTAIYANNSGNLNIGLGGSGSYFPGYISNFRLVRGVVVYTNGFLPAGPLAAVQLATSTQSAITGTQTSLLTCNAPTIIDGSTNALTITNNGTALVSTAVVPTFTNIVMNSTSADAYNSSTGNLGILFNNTTNRQLLNAYGFQFKDDGGIITPTNKTKVSFYGSAADTWTVPAGVTRIFVKMWGAGGGGGSYGGWRQGSLGGAGGFTHGLFNVVPGEVVQVRPGGVGTDRPAAGTAYPDGGGASTNGADNQYSSNGGGSSSIRIPSISATVYAMYAGGGGGGGACNGYAVNSGGAGGGLVGQCGTRSGNYTTTQYGKGGTQSAGGAAGTGSNTTGGAGSAGQGGTHQGNCYGGGGGGGYYGGGSGCYGSDNSMGGGGGGSGFIHGSALFGATYTGSYRTPPFSGDPDLMANPSLQNAYGGDESGQGGPGVVVFYY